MPTNYPNSAPARKPWERPASAAFAPPNPGAPAREEATTTGAASTTAGEPASSSTSTSAISRSAAATQHAERAAAPTPGPQRPQQAPADDVIAPPSESVSPLLAPRRRTRGLLIAITAFVLVVAGSVAAGAWAIGSMSSTTSTSSRPNTPAATPTGEHAPTAAAAPTADPTDPCPDTTNGKVTTGDDEGDVVGGAEVIKRFNFAYYTWRSGIRAHEVVAPDAQVGSVADLEAGIKTIPAGTTFCLSVTDRGEGLWAVELAHNTPDPADRRVWFQLVQTVDNDGRTWIVSIDTDKRKGLSSP